MFAALGDFRTDGDKASKSFLLLPNQNSGFMAKGFMPLYHFWNN